LTQKGYLNKTVDDVSILESSVNNDFVELIKNTVNTGSKLNHWEILVSFG
jgi:hypothetical protein